MDARGSVLTPLAMSLMVDCAQSHSLAIRGCVYPASLSSRMTSDQFMGSHYRPAESIRNGQPISGIPTLADMAKRERTEYGARVFQARTRARLTQPQLAKAVGMSQGTLGELEYNAHSSRFTAQIATACNVRAEWLATGEGPLVDASTLSPDIIDLAAKMSALPPKQRAFVIDAAQRALAALEFAKEAVANGLNQGTQNTLSPHEASDDGMRPRVKGATK
jgi:transcriptional regulator with XRE-family HTH domain